MGGAVVDWEVRACVRSFVSGSDVEEEGEPRKREKPLYSALE